MPVDVNRLRQDRVYESRVPIGSLAADLASIESLAAQWRAARKRLFLTGALTLAAGCIALPLFLPLGLALTAVAVYLFYRAKRYPRAIAHAAARSSVLRALAEIIASDADAKSPVTIRFAFDPKRELLVEAALQHRRNGKQRLYKASWLSLEVVLHDGTTFTETIDNLIRQRSFTNPRGKSKTKTRTLSLVSLRFAYPSDVYGDVTPLRDRMAKEIRLPGSAALRGLEATSRIVKAKALVAQPADLAQATGMLALGVYRMLNLSREIQKRRRAQPRTGGAQ